MGVAELKEVPRNTIICGDCLEVMADWPDGCVDMIFTDPDYTAANVEASFSILTDNAPRLLRDGGYLFAYCGAETLPIAMSVMAVSDLLWFWLFTVRHAGGQPRLWHKKLMVGSKPVLVYTKGKPDPLPWGNCDITEAQRGRKASHPWEQGISFPIREIRQRAREGGLVLDCFCGSGAFCEAALLCGRDYVGIEINPDYVKVAERRLAQKVLF